jgi:hypothetical protein
MRQFLLLIASISLFGTAAATADAVICSDYFGRPAIGVVGFATGNFQRFSVVHNPELLLLHRVEHADGSMLLASRERIDSDK